MSDGIRKLIEVAHTFVTKTLGGGLLNETERQFRHVQSMANLPGLARQRIAGMLEYGAGIVPAIFEARGNVGANATLVPIRRADVRLSRGRSLDNPTA